MLKREIFITNDGSVSVKIPELNENYHSKHGAIQESQHIYINNGLKYINKKNINIFEIGYGTGLNAILTFLETLKQNIKINYTSIEKYPLTLDEYNKLNYFKLLNIKDTTIINKFKKYWNTDIEISEKFNLKKIEEDFINFNFCKKYDLIFFDAFAPNIQPKLWTKNIFNKIHNNLNDNGIIVTYSVNGEVKRILKSLNFKIEQPDGPPGKRNMLRATKN